MRKLLVLAMLALLAGAASAQPCMGMFFSDTEFTDETTNQDVTAAPFNAYIVVQGLTIDAVNGYEVGIGLDASVFILGASGPNGWTNFGSNTNHLAGFGTPVPATNGAVVCCTLQMLYSGSDLIEITYGPADPASIPGFNGPVIADGSNPDILHQCALTNGGSFDEGTNVVATLHGPGIVAVEDHSLSSVKSLFQ